MDDKQRRYRLAHIRVIMWLTKHTPLAPTPYERNLFRQYIAGLLTLGEIIALAEAVLPIT